MLTKYVLLVISGDHINAKPTRVLITKITEFKKLQDNKLKAKNNVRANQ
jgi:hypothetical protein